MLAWWRPDLRVVGVGGSLTLARISDGRLKTMADGARPDMGSTAAAEWSKRFMTLVGTTWRWRSAWRCKRAEGIRWQKHRSGLMVSVDGP
jgi:hypothetical protein